MIMVRLFRVIIAERGGLDDTKRGPVALEETDERTEGHIEMVEIENEGGETITSVIENEEVKRSPGIPDIVCSLKNFFKK